jgi:hypothetical protein
VTITAGANITQSGGTIAAVGSTATLTATGAFSQTSTSALTWTNGDFTVNAASIAIRPAASSVSVQDC